MDPRTAYQRCHDLQYDSFGSVQGLLEAMRDYQRMAPQKLSDANLESILWNKVPIKLQKEVGQLTEGSLQELFQKLLKAEEIVRERERRSSSLRGSATHEFRNKASYRVPAQNTNYTLGQQKKDGKARFQQESLRNIKCFRCGKKGHIAKSCRVVVNQIYVEHPNKDQHIVGQHVESTQVVPLSKQNNQEVTTNKDTHAWICVLTVSNKSAKLGQTNVIGSVYKVDISIHGIPTRALIDSGSQVCIVRQQLLPIIKEKCNWKLSDCLTQNLPLNTQPVGAEGSVLGAIALVNLEVVIETTGKKLEVPCYVIDSTKPIWQGEVKNCGMIMGTNALVAFQFCISHFNGIVISPVSLMKQEGSADLLKSYELSKQTNSQPSTSVECAKSVQVEMSVPTPLLTESVTLPKLVKTQLDASQLSTELVTQPSNKSSSDETSNKTFVVVLKHTVQVMPGFTKWIDVQVLEQSTAIHHRTDVALCSTDIEIPKQCTEPSIPQHPCTESDQINLQQSNYLPMIVPDRNMIGNEHADGICNCQELSKVLLMNWGTQPQVFRKGTVVGHLEPVNIVSRNDPIWKDFWEELPDCSVEGVVRMCQTENRLDQLQQQIKIKLIIVQRLKNTNY